MGARRLEGRQRTAAAAGGGAGAGAGRAPAAGSGKAQAGAAAAAPAEITPLEVMLRVMRRHLQEDNLDRAAAIAKDAAPYVHQRLSAADGTPREGAAGVEGNAVDDRML